MPLFSRSGNQLSSIEESPIKLEKTLQHLFETNLEQLTGLQLVKSEHSIKNRRIDTLAFDPDTRSFVIIEYKRSKNYSVVDQGMAYLQLMLDHKAEFIVEYNESLGANLKRSQIDWSQSRLVFVAPVFTRDQREAVNFQDFNIELYEVTNYKKDLVNIVHHTVRPNAPSFKEVGPVSKASEGLKKELKTYREQDHMEQSPEEVIELYEQFKQRILDLGENIEIKPKKMVIGFKTRRIFTDTHLLKSGLKVWLNLKIGELDDPNKMARDVSNVGHWGNGAYEFKLSHVDELDYAIGLVRQAYRKYN